MFKKNYLLFVFLLLFVTCLQAQQTVIPLYKGPAPGSESWDWKEGFIPKGSGVIDVVHNVVTPTLTIYKPDAATANGTAVIICPGGGFFVLAINIEGTGVAAALTKKGITCFVLKYRLAHSVTNSPGTEMSEAIAKGDPDKKMEKAIPLSIADGKAAIAYVRSHAAEFSINPNRIGIMGFSAGGTVAASAAFNYTAENRPDFVAPIYAYMPPQLQGPVLSDAPPMFLAAASDDGLNLQHHSIDLYNKWNTAKKTVELHMYAKGGHGFGMITKNLPSDGWIERFGDWMNMLGLLKK